MTFRTRTPLTMLATTPALRLAWSLILSDPVGVLGPATLALWTQAAASMVFWGSINGDPLHDAASAGATWLMAALVALPLRWWILRSGARALGRPWRGVGGILPLLGTQLVISACQACVIGGVAGATTLAALLLASYGWWSLSALGLSLATLAAVFAVLLLRVVFGFAAVEVLCGGRSSLQALWASARRGRWRTALGAMVVGDVATGLGALACGAGALPGYPLSDLTILCAWEAE
jgi:hypothetical protein